MQKIYNRKNKAVAILGGSKAGNIPDFVEQADSLGRSMRERGIEIMICGNTHSGLTAICANTFQSLGGIVVEVNTEDFYNIDKVFNDKSVCVPNYSLVTSDMSIRKLFILRAGQAMKNAILSEKTHLDSINFIKNVQVIGAIALPGGVGTDDEIFSAMTYNQEASYARKYLKANKQGVPLILVNTAGVFNHIKEGIERKINAGLATTQDFTYFKMTRDAKEAVSLVINNNVNAFDYSYFNSNGRP